VARFEGRDPTAGRTRGGARPIGCRRLQPHCDFTRVRRATAV